MRDLDTLTLVFKSGNIKRYHIHSVIGEQNVAHHCWRVVMLLYYTVPNPSPNLIKAAMFHDCGEIITGDVPYTAKRDYVELKRMLDGIEKKFEEDNQLKFNIDTTEEVYLKVCDMLELAWFSKEQIDLGNKNFVAMFNKASLIVERLIKDYDISETFKSKVLDILQTLAIPGGTIYEY